MQIVHKVQKIEIKSNHIIKS